MSDNIYFQTYGEALKVFRTAKDPFKGKPVNNNTRLISLGTSYPDQGGFVVYSVLGLKLHDTVIVTYFPDGSYELDSGGWKTLTTKDRMNNYTPFHIHQENLIWYVNGIYLFKDGIRIEPDRTVKGDMTLEELKEWKYTKEKIMAFAKRFAEALPVPQPSGGDCWYCAFRDKEDRTWGDVADHVHLWHHIEEDYFVPSLLYNAMKERGYGNHIMYVFCIFEGTSGRDPSSYDRETSKRVLRDYLYRRLL